MKEILFFSNICDYGGGGGYVNTATVVFVWCQRKSKSLDSSKSDTINLKPSWCSFCIVTEGL